jgi:hypothetical protein
MQILGKKNKIMAKSDMDSVGTSILRTITAQQRLHNKSSTTSSSEQGLRNKPTTATTPTRFKEPAALGSSAVSNPPGAVGVIRPRRHARLGDNWAVVQMYYA